MKAFSLIVALLLMTPTMAQEKNSNPPLETIDQLIHTLYAVISGEKGEARDWELLKHLFLPDANLIPTQITEQDKTIARYMSPQDYIDSSGEYLVANGFFEIEIHREVHQFGKIAQVFSTYESFHSKNETVPFMRGINSIQLLNDGERWWVVNIYWMQENKEHPIPSKYLPAK